ncbi:MAG: hypothetical protein V1767_05295 [Chloroflexota bacterium]
MKNWLRKEKGQALPIVLSLLAIGGLTIAVSLNHISTSLKASRIVVESVDGIYAADAGVEYTMWSLLKGLSPPTQLAENINQMTVNVATDNRGTYTFYFGELSDINVHYNYLDVEGDIVWDETEQAYKYTITVTWEAPGGEPHIKLDQVGARMPVGYSYDNSSAAGFAGNLSLEEPDEPRVQDGSGAWLLNWTFDPPRPQISEDEPVKTQSFYISGSGSLSGEYAWVVAERTDIGVVGEITGTRYLVTSTAIHSQDGRTRAKIIADILKRDDGSIFIMSWQISK